MKVPECEYGFDSKSRTLSGIIDSPLMRFILTHPSVHCLPSSGALFWPLTTFEEFKLDEMPLEGTLLPESMLCEARLIVLSTSLRHM